MVEWCTQNLPRNGSISRGTSHATPKERYQYTTSVDINNTRYKRIQSLIQNHMPLCAASLPDSREQRYIKAMNNNTGLVQRGEHVEGTALPPAPHPPLVRHEETKQICTFVFGVYSHGVVVTAHLWQNPNW